MGLLGLQHKVPGLTQAFGHSVDSSNVSSNASAANYLRYYVPYSFGLERNCSYRMLCRPRVSCSVILLKVYQSLPRHVNLAWTGSGMEVTMESRDKTTWLLRPRGLRNCPFIPGDLAIIGGQFLEAFAVCTIMHDIESAWKKGTERSLKLRGVADNGIVALG